MAGDCEAAANGIIITAVKSGFGHTLNTTPDLTSMASVQCTCLNGPVDVEPEKFRWMGTSTAKVTISQLDSEKAETFNVVCHYEITTSP